MNKCTVFLPSANEVCESYVFTPVCHSVHGGGGGGVRGRGGACMAGGVCGGGGMHGRGACVVGGVCGRGHAWQRGACMPRTPPPDTTRYGRSMRRRYASYWNAFLFMCVRPQGLVQTYQTIESSTMKIDSKEPVGFRIR